MDGCKITSKIRFGRGMDGDISNVIIKNVVVDQSKRRSVHGINFMIGGIGHQDTGNLKNILLENITLINTGQPIQHHSFVPGTWIGRSENIVFKNIVIKGRAKASTFLGIDRLTIHDVSSDEETKFHFKDNCGVSLHNLKNIRTMLDSSVTNVVNDRGVPECKNIGARRRKINYVNQTLEFVPNFS